MSRGDRPYTHGPSFALGPSGPPETIWKHL
jgi:hypothetical protein